MKTKIKNTINFVLLLDKSGSMSSNREVTVSGADEVTKTIRKESKQNGINATVSLFTFDDRLDKHYVFTKASETGSIQEHYTIRGGTDICGAILKTLPDIVAPAGERTCFILFTDGGDGSNQQSFVKARLDAASALETFVYVGPGYIAQNAASMGFKSVTGYETTQSGTRAAFSKIAQAVKHYIERAGDDFSADLTEGFFADLENKTTMTVNELSCVVNTPEALKSKKKGQTEEANRLPPYSPARSYVVDEYPACPSNWMHGSAKASSYFIPVEQNRGMWLDLNPTAKDEHHIAAVISVQGVNPITGQKTDVLRLEQYKTKCPVHDVEFQQDRFCPECKYKWPAQNYISSNTTPDGFFWLDGFRAENGKVRQYVFTEEESRGVASNVIGKDRVFAIGIAFYRSKAKKPKVEAPEVYTRGMVGGGYSGFSGCATFGAVSGYAAPAGALSMKSLRRSSQNRIADMYSLNSLNSGQITCSTNQEGTKGGSIHSASAGDVHEPTAVQDSLESIPLTAFVDADGSVDQTLYQMAAPGAAAAIEEVKVEKSYEVGAGASIDQQVHADTESLDFWEAEPAGMIYVNYCDLATVKKILAAGKRVEQKEGFLAAVPVGN